MYTVHSNGVIMSAMASQITCVSIVYSIVCSDADQRKHQSSASLAFVRGIHRWLVHSLHKGPVTREWFHLMTSSWHTLNGHWDHIEFVCTHFVDQLKPWERLKTMAAICFELHWLCNHKNVSDHHAHSCHNSIGETMQRLWFYLIWVQNGSSDQ